MRVLGEPGFGAVFTGEAPQPSSSSHGGSGTGLRFQDVVAKVGARGRNRRYGRGLAGDGLWTACGPLPWERSLATAAPVGRAGLLPRDEAGCELGSWEFVLALREPRRVETACR